MKSKQLGDVWREAEMPITGMATADNLLIRAPMKSQQSGRVDQPAFWTASPIVNHESRTALMMIVNWDGEQQLSFMIVADRGKELTIPSKYRPLPCHYVSPFYESLKRYSCRRIL